MGGTVFPVGAILCGCTSWNPTAIATISAFTSIDETIAAIAATSTATTAIDAISAMATITTFVSEQEVIISVPAIATIAAEAA